jgi:GABA(A) receptor-associated protein
MFSGVKDNINEYLNKTNNVITNVVSNVSNENNKISDYYPVIHYPVDCKYITEFRKQDLEERVTISNKIILKYPDRIPIIVDSKKDINLNKNKYIVSHDLTVGQFMFILKKRILLEANKSVFLLCNNLLIPNTELIRNLYYNRKDIDGFLYLIIVLENTFGN